MQMKRIHNRYICYMRRGAAAAVLTVIAVMSVFIFSGCGTSDADKQRGSAPEIEGLVYDRTLELKYAEGFDVYYYDGGYKVIETYDSGQKYLVVPEGSPVPESLSGDKGNMGGTGDMIIIKQPLDNVYMAASSVMSLFDAMGALDDVRFTSTDMDGWYIDSVTDAMKEGSLIFTGKYNQPDYEGLIEGDCDIAIESTMIFHSPEVKEKLEELGLPVFVDYSSYESDPMGRTEWIKLYGAMTGREEAAESFFGEQLSLIEYLDEFKNTEKTVAYFFINSAGNAVVRKSEDYIPKMIETAGGRYVFDDLTNPDSKAPSVKISMEQFYDTAADADYLIYNATIDSPLNSMDELFEKSGLFKEFKAVKEGNVWTTDKYMYQAADITAEFINDIHRMVTGGSEDEMVFLKKVE